MVADGARRRIAASSTARFEPTPTSSSSSALATPVVVVVVVVVVVRPVSFRGGAHLPTPTATLGREGSFGARGGMASSSTPSLRRRADSDPARRRSARRTGPPSHASESLDGDEDDARGGGTHRVAPRLENAGRVRSSALASASGLSMNVEDDFADEDRPPRGGFEAEAEAARDREAVAVSRTADGDLRSPAPPRTSPKGRFHHASASSSDTSSDK